MNRLAAVLLWILGTALSGAALFTVLGVFSRLDRHLWMLFGLAIVLGFVMRSWPNVKAGVQWSLTVFCMAVYVAMIGGAWVLGIDKTSLSTTLRTLSLHVQELALGVCVVSALTLLVMAILARNKSPWASGWLLGIVGCSAAVAFFSGAQGAPGGAAQWLASHFSLDLQTADTIVHYARKTVHFTFYGCFAWFGYRAALGAAANRTLAVFSAFAIALSHAFVDEWRQLSSPGRTGSLWDVLLDAAGMAFFLLLAVRAGRNVAKAEIRR